MDSEDDAGRLVDSGQADSVGAVQDWTDIETAKLLDP